MKLEGEISEINVIERLVELGRETFTGAVRFENDGIIKIIYFKTGDVLSASTNDRSDSVDEILLRAGKVTREHVKQALAKRKETETLGDALLSLGFITRKELTWARRVQVIGAIRSITAWTAGSYTIVADYLPKREEGTIFPLAQIIVELIVTDQDRAKFDRSLDGGNAVLVPAPEFHESFGRLGLNQDAADIASHVDGVSSASEIAVASGKDAFNVYKLLSALATLGYLTQREKPQPQLELPMESGPDLDFGSAAVMDSDQTWRIAPGVTPKVAPNVAWPPPHEETVDAGPAEAEHESEALTPPIDSATAAPEVELSNWEIHEPAAGEAPEPIALPVTAPPEPPMHEEPRWGFDEAQIEAARRADVPMTFDEVPESQSMKAEVEEAAKPNRWVGALLGGVAIIALAFGGFAAWEWWQRHTATSIAEAPPVVVPHRRLPTAPRVPATAASATAPAVSGTIVPPVATPTATAAVSGSMAGSGRTAPPAGSAPLAVTATRSAVPPPAATAPSRTAPPPPAHPGAMAATPSTTRIVRSPSGAATITNAGTHAAAAPKPAAGAPAAAPTPNAPDATKAHYDQMAASFASNASGNFTVQFELVCRAASLTLAIREGGNSVWFVPTSHKGQGCYRVFWGHYATRAEAQNAISELPASLRSESAPTVVSVPKP